MLEIMISSGAVISFVVSLFFIWFSICNSVTLYQRLFLTKIVFDFGNYFNDLSSIDEYYKVTYTKHLLYVLTFRNPFVLYREVKVKNV